MKAYISKKLKDLDDLVSRKDLFTDHPSEAQVVFVLNSSEAADYQDVTVVCHVLSGGYAFENLVYMPLFDGINKNSYLYPGTQLFCGDEKRINDVVSILKSGTHLGFKSAARSDDYLFSKNVVDLYQCIMDDIEAELLGCKDPKKAANILAICGGIRVREDFFKVKEEPVARDTDGVNGASTEEDAALCGPEVINKEPTQPSPFAQGREF